MTVKTIIFTPDDRLGKHARYALLYPMIDKMRVGGFIVETVDTPINTVRKYVAMVAEEKPHFEFKIISRREAGPGVHIVRCIHGDVETTEERLATLPAGAIEIADMKFRVATPRRATLASIEGGTRKGKNETIRTTLSGLKIGMSATAIGISTSAITNAIHSLKKEGMYFVTREVEPGRTMIYRVAEGYKLPEARFIYFAHPRLRVPGVNPITSDRYVFTLQRVSPAGDQAWVCGELDAVIYPDLTAFIGKAKLKHEKTKVKSLVKHIVRLCLQEFRALERRYGTGEIAA